MKKLFRFYKSRLFDISLLVLAHWALLFWLAKNGVVARLFGAGAHSPKLLVTSAIMFLVLRLVVLLLVPGFLTCYVGMRVLDWLRARIRKSMPNDECLMTKE